MQAADAELELLLTGRAERPSPRQRLRAGDLELDLDGCDLRDIEYRGLEVAQQVFVAVRDEAWNTLPGRRGSLRSAQMSVASFEVGFTRRHAGPADDIDVEWHGTIVGDEQGRLAYEVETVANRDLTYNRIGLNVFHGTRTFAGRPFRSSLGDDMREGRLPTDIGPQAVVGGRLQGLWPPFDHLELSPVDGIWIVVDFEGDEFEMEDQRNFGDATFKTYSTPLQRVSPFHLPAGQRLRQRLTISVVDTRKARSARRKPKFLEVRVSRPTGQRVAPFGLGHASDDAPLSADERARLAPLRADHIRVELLGGEGAGHARRRLAAGAEASRQLGADLWVDVVLDRSEPTMLSDLMSLIAASDPQPRYVFVATRAIEALSDGVSATAVTAARDILQAASPSTTVGCGAQLSFADVTRAPFDASFVRALTFPLCPTVHRRDDASVLENVDAVSDMVTTARRLLGDRPLVVGPITLAALHGPYPGGPRSPGDPPPRIDERQVSLLGAAYTAGVFAALTTAGVEGMTCFETAGWLGVTERDEGSSMPERFHSMPGTVFPLWHVLADLAEWRAADILATDVEPDPVFTSPVATLAVRSARGIHCLIASLRRERQYVELGDLPGDRIHVRTLDAASAEAAMTTPEVFRSASETRASRGGRLRLDLDPYAIARVDIPA